MSWNKNKPYEMNPSNNQLSEVANLIRWTMGDPNLPVLSFGEDITLDGFIGTGIGIPAGYIADCILDVTFNKDFPGKIKATDKRKLYYSRRDIGTDFKVATQALYMAVSGNPTNEEVIEWVEKYYLQVNSEYVKEGIRINGTSSSTNSSTWMTSLNQSYLHKGGVSVYVGKPDFAYLGLTFEEFTAD